MSIFSVDTWFQTGRCATAGFYSCNFFVFVVLEVGLKGSPTSDVGGPTMESAAKRICETNRHLDAFNSQAFEHLLNGVFIGVDDDPFWIQHQHVHRQPLGGHPQRVIIRHKRKRRFDNGPAGLLKHLDLMTRSVRVAQDEPRPDDVERGVNVHRIRVLERDRMNVDSFGS